MLGTILSYMLSVALAACCGYFVLAAVNHVLYWRCARLELFLGAGCAVLLGAGAYGAWP